VKVFNINLEFLPKFNRNAITPQVENGKVKMFNKFIKDEGGNIAIMFSTVLLLILAGFGY